MQFSEFLNSRREACRALVSELGKSYAYVGILGSDVKSTAVRVNRAVSDIGEGGAAECGFVVKLNNGRGFYEYSTDDISGDKAALAEKIIAAVAKRYGVSSEDVLGVKRTKNIKNARNIAMYIIRQATDLSLNSIGTMFERDHSTIHSNITAIEKQLKTDIALENEIADIRREIKR